MADEKKTNADAEAKAAAEREKKAQADALAATEEARKRDAETLKEQANSRPEPSQDELDAIKSTQADNGAVYKTRDLKA